MLRSTVFCVALGIVAAAVAEEAPVSLPAGGLSSWTAEDVQLWANSQPWAEAIVADVFLSNGVSGKTLEELAPAALCRVIQLPGEDADLCLQIKDEAEREALVASFPGDLWEARDQDRRMFYFYSAMVHACPRGAAVYSYFWQSDLVQQWIELAKYREQSGETELGVEQVALVARLPTAVLVVLFALFPSLMWAVVVDPLLLQLPLIRLAIWVSMSAATASDIQGIAMDSRGFTGKAILDRVLTEARTALMTAGMFWLMFWLVPWFVVDYSFWVSVITTPLLNLLALVLTLPGISLAWDSTMPALLGALPAIARLVLMGIVFLTCPASLGGLLLRPLVGLPQSAPGNEFNAALQREIRAFGGEAPADPAGEGAAVNEPEPQGGRVHLIEASTTTTTTTHPNGVTEVVVEEEEMVVESGGEGDDGEEESLRRRVD